MKFHEKLLILRKGKGLSQEKLGNEIGVSRQAVTKWENGTALPETEKVILLSEFFNVTTDYLLKDSVETPQADTSVPAGNKMHQKVPLRLVIGASLLATGVVIWLILLVLSRCIPVYSLMGSGASLANFLEYHQILYIGYAAVGLGLVGLLLAGVELLMQRVKRTKC